MMQARVRWPYLRLQPASITCGTGVAVSARVCIRGGPVDIYRADGAGQGGERGGGTVLEPTENEPA